MAQPQKPQTINLALQGGGAHGAFTWGVLDALLEGGAYQFDGISGTSAGAMNAVVLAHGFAQAAEREPDDAQARHRLGCELAREALRTFWEAVGTLGVFLTANPSNFASQWMPWLKPLLAPALSPAQSNPMDINPLRSILRRQLDFEAINRHSGHAAPRLFVCATNVRTGRSKIFSDDEISAESVMASACLPQIFHAVEIDGEHYWDGGFSGNPAIYPLIYRTRANDVLLVQINPIELDHLPQSMAEIQERINEVTFNASLLAELRAIEFVRRLIDEGRLDMRRYKYVRMHRVDGGAYLKTFGSDSKLRTDMGFLLNLFERGRDSAKRWLAVHQGDIGVRSTLEE
ncbi:patatin-like phospholipase family protein [Corticibacter populi]|uniref:Patatin-like phospholipase family protein n=1 Tax=Corticibacter populi TaxID=1550736 RepID=A0A3M6QXQ7_9BURK|nr:patatin-like phospholipase family protein [Corticibacter populi]RMX07797.1 patatin-like phospholipase family protein [Corticibacter populi]RZS35023.1 NTE family protein [Corticibacter populi]